MSYYIYIIRLSWGRCKIGYTNNLDRRFYEHQDQLNAKHVCFWFPTRNRKTALKFERYLLNICKPLRFWGKKEQVFLPFYSWIVLFIPVMIWYLFFEAPGITLLIILIICYKIWTDLQ